jgi:hypothetical protein
MAIDAPGQGARVGHDGALPDGRFRGVFLGSAIECQPFRLNLSAKSFPPLFPPPGRNGLDVQVTPLLIISTA